jgi:hypothetical protein
VSRCLAVIVLGAAEDEGTFWIQLLMVVLLAAGVGIYGLVKSRVKRVEQEAHDEIIETIIEPPKPLVKKRNLTGGMELLARNFLVDIVEQTDSPDQRDIEMRRLCFAELVRRGELWSLASNALKIYTLDEDGFYGKVIRREAMAELAGRTGKSPQSHEGRQTVDATDSAPAFQNRQGLDTAAPKGQIEHPR